MWLSQYTFKKVKNITVTQIKMGMGQRCIELIDKWTSRMIKLVQREFKTLKERMLEKTTKWDTKPVNVQ